MTAAHRRLLALAGDIRGALAVGVAIAATYVAQALLVAHVLAGAVRRRDPRRRRRAAGGDPGGDGGARRADLGG